VSSYLEYDPSLFVLERDEDGWVPVECASFSYSTGYTPDKNGTLIFDAESATIAMSYWDVIADPLYPADRIRASYDGVVFFLGTIDSTSLAYAVHPDAPNHGATYRVDLTATAVGTYAAALERIVCWAGLPVEPAIDRIQRWVTVVNW
jgi:hypothetical protein